MGKIFNYWYVICSFCQQGRLFVFKNTTDNNLYLHCEECERGWLNPDEVDDDNESFLTLVQKFEATEANGDDIEKYGWQKYPLHKEEE